MFLHLFFMPGHDLTETDINHIPRVISCPAKIMRLRDDMGSAMVRKNQNLPLDDFVGSTLLQMFTQTNLICILVGAHSHGHQ